MFVRFATRSLPLLLLLSALLVAAAAYAQTTTPSKAHDEAAIKAPATEGNRGRAATSNAAPSKAEAPQKRRAPASDDAPFVRYTGELMRDSKSAISGVFTITFELYEHEIDSTYFRTTSQFVAIDLCT